MRFNLFRSLSILIIIVTIIAPITILAEAQELKDYVVEVLVQYRDRRSVDIAIKLGCYVEREFKLFNTTLMLCLSGVVNELKGVGLNVVKNFDVKIDTVFKEFKPFNPSVLQQGLELAIPLYWSWAISRVSADIALNYLGEDGSDTVIAVLDTGIDPTHPLLAGKIVAWIEFDAKGKPVCSKPHDTHGHGTWVSSIAVGGDGKRYIFGVAPNGKIMAALVLHYGRGTAAQILAGLEWVLQPYDPCTNTKLDIKPNAVSMSFGATGNYSNVFLPAIKKLIENGIVAVAAIGNSGPYTSANPGNIWGVIGVGATDYDNDIASFSSYEDVEWPNPPSEWPFKDYYPSQYRKPDVVAPGVDVPGAFPGGLLAIASGTSASTPIVAGVVAIVSAKLKNQGLSGAKLVERVYDIITTTSTRLTNPGAGYGLIDAYLSIASAKNIDVRIVNLDVYPLTTNPLSNVTLNIIGVNLGVNIDIYVSGSKVYSGTIRSRYITLPIPLTHGGGNTITIISRNGLIYGKTLVQVVPTIFSERLCYWGKICKVLISGVGIGDTMGIYFGSNIMTLYSSNLRGSFNASFITPIVEEGYYLVTAIDFSRPEITLQTQIYVYPTQLLKPIITNNTLIINNTYIITKNQTYNTIINNTYIHVLPLYVRSKEFYIANTIDFLDIYIYNGSINRIAIDKKILDTIDISILNISRTEDGVYRIWIRIGSVKVDEVYVRLNITIIFENIVVPYIITIKILKEDPNKLTVEKVSQLSDIVEKYMRIVNSLEGEISNMNKSITNLDKNLGNLNSNLNSFSREVNDRIEFLSNSLDNIEQRSMLLQTMLLVAIMLSIVAILLSIITVFKIRHR
jgi:subtilisin family serine protease